MDQMYENAINNINVKLFEPYQSDGCKWMLNRETSIESFKDEPIVRGGILADEVGLGKTIMAICMIVGNIKPHTLVVLPKSLVLQWKEQIEKFTNKVDVHLIHSSKTILARVESIRPQVYLMSQSLLNMKYSIAGTSIVHQFTWDRIFVDEAHMLRNNKSKLYESCMLLKGDIKWALTATPVMNRMGDFVNIMNWVGVSRFICQTEKNEVTRQYILRRTKEDIRLDGNTVSDCTIQVKYIPFESHTEADLYLKVYHKERRMIKKKNQKVNVPDLLEHLLRVRQLCIHPQLYLDGMSKKKEESYGSWDTPVTKLNELLRCVQKQPPDDKTLIFCQFVKEMDEYERLFSASGYECVRLDGTMSTTERQQNVDYFKSNDAIKLFIIQINTGGQGINLQIANHIYIMSPNWNPAIEHQAIGRAYRTGQTKHVYVTKFCITSGDSKIPFIEENIIQLQEKKKKIIAFLLNDERIVNDGIIFNYDMSIGLSTKDIYHLFNLYNQ